MNSPKQLVNFLFLTLCLILLYRVSIKEYVGFCVLAFGLPKEMRITRETELTFISWMLMYGLVGILFSSSVIWRLCTEPNTALRLLLLVPVPIALLALSLAFTGLFAAFAFCGGFIAFQSLGWLVMGYSRISDWVESAWSDLQSPSTALKNKNVWFFAAWTTLCLYLSL
jgi:hypothetical protein